MFTYLAFLACISALALVYSAIHRRMLKRRFGYRLFPGYLLLVAVGFFIFEILAIRLGWWSINSDKTVGITVFGVPIEEALFYIVIPQICLFVWALLRIDHPMQNIKRMSAHHIKDVTNE